jgi:hypothetical protein
MIGMRKLKKKQHQQRKRNWPKSNKRLRGSNMSKNPFWEDWLQCNALKLTDKTSTGRE